MKPRTTTADMVSSNIIGGWTLGMELVNPSWESRLLDYLLWLAHKLSGLPMQDCSALVMDDKETTAIGKPYASPIYGRVVIVPYCWLVEQPEYKAIHDDYMAELAVKVLTR